MADLRVNYVTNLQGNGPVEFTNGITVPSSASLFPTSSVVINTTGVVTATSFVGVGSQITNIPGNGALIGKAIALTLVTI